jgi:hypothetical protein
VYIPKFPFCLVNGYKRLIFILVCLLCLSISGFAYKPLQDSPADTIQLRTFSAEKLQKYLNDEDFKYDRDFRPEAPNLWQRFKIWLLTKILQALSNEQTYTFWKWAIYIFCGVVILYVILKLTKTNVRGLFFGQAQGGKIAFSEMQENIHELNFEKLIAEAIAAQQYGKAIRLFYLKTLKQLTDRKLIDWRINKTNYDYVRELGSKDMAPSFRNLTFLFEYIYYGDFQITQTDFEQAQLAFKNFEEQLKR